MHRSLGEDLSEALRPKPRQEPDAKAAAEMPEPVAAVQKAAKPVFDAIKSTHGEQRRWARQDKFNRVVCL